jgi:redox-sensitive bicupin YhaK (pirin superfamily)
MTARSIIKVVGHPRIDGVVPRVRGQRALPTQELRPVDPFVMLDHIGPEQVGLAFHVDGHPHPHRGFETLTMLFEGRMDPVDSMGNSVLLVSGSTQNMVAGRGIEHGGDMAADSETGRFHEVQLWVNMPTQPTAIGRLLTTATGPVDLLEIAPSW